MSQIPDKKHPWKKDDAASAKRRGGTMRANEHFLTIKVDTATRDLFEQVRQQLSKEMGSHVSENELGRIAIRYYCTSKRADPSNPGSRGKR